MRISRVVISDKAKIFSEEELGDILEKKSALSIFSAVAAEERNVKDKKVNKKDMPKEELIDECARKELEKKITMYIYSHDLIQHGHYRLNRRFAVQIGLMCVLYFLSMK